MDEKMSSMLYFQLFWLKVVDELKYCREVIIFVLGILLSYPVCTCVCKLSFARLHIQDIM